MLIHTGLILPPNNYENSVTAAVWSPNGTILAAALNDNTIYIFHHGGIKHLIQVECSVSVVSKSNLSIKDIAFSPDSTKLAVAHVNGTVCVHKIQIKDWTCDSTMCNEFLQNSPVTCLVWSTKGLIVFGLETGKVRACQIETEMTWTLYSTDSPTIAVTVNDSGIEILSSHVDGTIFHSSLTSDGSSNTANRILTYLTIPQILTWAQDGILVGDCDGHIVFYDNHGKTLKAFDYSEENPAENFNYTCCSSTKESLAINLCGKVHLYIWNKENEFWDEIDSSTAHVIGTVTTLALKKDGSKLAIGGLNGAVAEFKVTKSINDAEKSVGILICNVDSNLVSEIALENNNGLPGSTIWPIKNKKGNSSIESVKYLEKSFDEKLKLRKPTKIEKPEKFVKSKANETNLSSFIKTEAKKRSEIVDKISTWNDNNNEQVKAISDHKKSKSTNEIDYISSDITSTYDKSSFTVDFGSIILTSEDELESTMNDSAIASKTIKKKKLKAHRIESIPTPSVVDGMLLGNLNDIPYDPTIDPPCWKGELQRSDKLSSSCRNCGRLHVSMNTCPRCKDAYHNWNRDNYTENDPFENACSPIKFTKQYTPEELREDFTLQLALLASLSPGLQRILEQQMFGSKKDQCC